MGLMEWFRGGKKAGSISEKAAVRLDGPGDFEIDIVGESHYQAALNKIAGGKTADGHRLEIEAVLIHEDSNKYDDKAVAVHVSGQLVGYLDKRLARQFRKRMNEAGVAGHPAKCNAIIVGGWDRGGKDTGHYGVKLDLTHGQTQMLLKKVEMFGDVRG